jgi:hypothetical protein
VASTTSLRIAFGVPIKIAVFVCPLVAVGTGDREAPSHVDVAPQIKRRNVVPIAATVGVVLLEFAVIDNVVLSVSDTNTSFELSFSTTNEVDEKLAVVVRCTEAPRQKLPAANGDASVPDSCESALRVTAAATVLIADEWTSPSSV